MLVSGLEFVITDFLFASLRISLDTGFYPKGRQL